MLLLGLGIIIFFNVLSLRSISINVSIFSIFIAFIVFNYFKGKYVNELIIDDVHKTITINSKRNNGSDIDPIKLELKDINFIYEYENLSKSVSVPVLKINKDKSLIVKLYSESDWEKEVISNLIEVLKDVGVKGKVTRIEKSFSDEFDNFN